MKLTEIENERALDTLADLIDPAVEILRDNEIKAAFMGKNYLKAVKIMLKEHKEASLRILAAMDGVPFEEYKCNPLTVPKKLMELASDKELMDFLSSADVTETKSASISENTEENTDTQSDI